MKISDRALALLKKHEGLRLRAYDDLRPGENLEPGDPIVGTVTIGYGHVRTAKPGMEITGKEAEELLREDLKRFEAGVTALTAEYPRKGGLLQYEFDALVSFAFNVGLGALEQSTLLAKLLAFPEYPKEEIADEFLRWVYSKGRKLRGLEQRRSDERDVFLGYCVAYG
jgi:lysozyme